MGDVVGLKGQQPSAAMQPQEGVIAALETLIEEARAGNIQHLMCVWTDGVTAPGDLYAGPGEAKPVAELIGAMELLKHTMLMSQFQETTIKL